MRLQIRVPDRAALRTILFSSSCLITPDTIYLSDKAKSSQTLLFAKMEERLAFVINYLLPLFLRAHEPNDMPHLLGVVSLYLCTMVQILL